MLKGRIMITLVIGIIKERWMQTNGKIYKLTKIAVRISRLFRGRGSRCNMRRGGGEMSRVDRNNLMALLINSILCRNRINSYRKVNRDIILKKRPILLLNTRSFNKKDTFRLIWDRKWRG